MFIQFFHPDTAQAGTYSQQHVQRNVQREQLTLYRVKKIKKEVV